MNSSARQIPQSEWERHKDTILELYRAKPLKDVRAEMQNQHGFEASSWKYEMQLKRWNIRKNATRKEWQQYFAANKDRSIPSSLGHAPGAASIRHEPHALKTVAIEDIQHVSQNMTNAFGGYASVPEHTDPLFSSISAPYNLELHTGSSLALFENVGGPVQPLDLNSTSLDTWSSPLVSGLQSPFPRHDSPDRAAFAFLGLPAENNMIFVGVLKNARFRRELPSSQLEHSLRSKGIAFDQGSGSAILGGFAARFVAGVLSSNNKSMIRCTPPLQNFLSNLESQIPGERSALITDDQAFETKFVRVLIFSVLNGFAGLNDVPIENILRFLNRFVVNKLLLDILEQCPQHVSKTLADNIFRAAIEAADTKVLNLLLSRKLVNIDETACLHDGEKYTPIERAAVLGSLKLVESLIEVGANVNKSHARFLCETMGGAVGALINDIRDHLMVRNSLNDWWRPVITPVTLEILEVLIAAGAQVHPRMLTLDGYRRTVDLDFHICQHVPAESHQDFFRLEPRFDVPSWPLKRLVVYLDDGRATKVVRNVISLCHQADCNKCLVHLGESRKGTAIDAALAGKVGLVQLLLDEADLGSTLPEIFLAAIGSQKPAMIDLILSHSPDLDPPAIGYRRDDEYYLTTPISEAVRHGNENLIWKLEAEGSLEHLNEGNRFEALVAGAAEAGDTVYMRKLLARAVTSKQAYREIGQALYLAILARHQDIVQMLLEAGATPSSTIIRPPFITRRESLHERLSEKHIQMVHTLITCEASKRIMRETLDVQADLSIIADVAREYPGFDFLGPDGLIDVAKNCMKSDTPECFKELLKNLPWDGNKVDRCLATAVELGHHDLIGFLLDTGANPYNNRVLRAVIPDRPEMLQLLFQRGTRRQSMPKCMGVSILKPVMGNEAGNAEALDELIRIGAINFARLEDPYEEERIRHPLEERHDRILFTPLGMAIQGIPDRLDSNMVAMRKFLDAGADPDGISKLNEQWTTGSPLMTALMVAIENGLEEAVNILLDHGADVNARPRIRTTRTALQFAVELGNIEMTHLLLSRHADVNSSASPRGGATALQFAAMTGNCNMVADLLDHGAQLDALPSRIDGMWPLEGAAANGRIDMIRYFWELNVRAVASGTFPDGFSERHCLRAMNFARENGHIGCRDLISDLSGIAVERLETDEYGASWIAY